MIDLKLLDCTLRDGGYVNDWNFGYSKIKNIISYLEDSGVNILELGFLRNEVQDNDRTIFSCIENVNALITKKKKNVVYMFVVLFHTTLLPSMVFAYFILSIKKK